MIGDSDQPGVPITGSVADLRTLNVATVIIAGFKRLPALLSLSAVLGKLDISKHVPYHFKTS